jgi:hypothetical protein
MSEEIICGQCAAIYSASQIDVFDGDEYVSTLAELHGEKRQRREASPLTRAMRRSVGLNGRPRTATPEPDKERLRKFRAYTFYCPEGHFVDGSPGEQFGLAILGASGSSKSHMLPAIVCELEELSVLRKLGIRLTPGLYPNKKLAGDVSEVYQYCHRLPPTKPGQMLGPFGYKLRTGTDSAGKPKQCSLLLFDIAGEDLGELARIADVAAYVIRCKALLVLIDPTEFMPTDFTSGPVNPRSRRRAASEVRAGIRVLAEALAQAWGVSSSREVPISICFAVSKADAVQWPADFDWAAQTTQSISAVDGDIPLTEALTAFSAATEKALGDLGGELIIDEVEECFHPDRVRYVAASATSTMPIQPADGDGREWVDDPEPNGVALGILHLLDLAGMVSGPPAAVTSDS